MDKTCKIYAIIVTNKCNLKCRYCYAEKHKSVSMSLQTAKSVCKYIAGDILENNISDAQIIFEGNEPLLNFKIVKFIVETLAVCAKTRGFKANFSMFSNFFALNKSILKWIKNNSIYLHTSLDGPKDLHDFHRGRGSFDRVSFWIGEIKRLKIPLVASAVVTKFSLQKSEDIIETYFEHGLDSINLRFLHPIGFGKLNWAELGYTAEDFMAFREKSLAYLIGHNLRGNFMVDQKALFIFNKLSKNNEMIYLFSPPCNGIKKQVCIDPEGDLYTCDEGRGKPEIFKIGDVENGINQVKADSFFSMVEKASKENCGQSACNLKDICGPCLAVNDPILKCSKYQGRCFSYEVVLLENLLQSKKNREVFLRWKNGIDF